MESGATSKVAVHMTNISGFFFVGGGAFHISFMKLRRAELKDDTAVRAVNIKGLVS
jgi:hypothetical protein